MRSKVEEEIKKKYRIKEEKGDAGKGSEERKRKEKED